MRMTLMAAAAALAASIGSAAAADLGGYAGSVKDDAVYGPTTWAGLYAGASLGYGWGDSEQDYGAAGTFSVDADGAVYGVQVGYNIQRGSTVFGVEVGFNGTDMEGSRQVADDLSTEIDWYATAVARLGFAFGSNLVYGFGGVAWGDVTTVVNRDVSEDSHVGWTAGLGIERALSDNFSVRLEYAHVDLGEEDTFANQCSTCQDDVAFDVVKIGLNYKFGDRYEALK